MKFVRWLGAFGSSSSLLEAAFWETSQNERQVAAEPLIKGKSLIRHAKIGLSINSPSASFARGWLWDAYTDHRGDGILVAKRSRGPCEYKSMDRFLAALNKRGGHGHAEASFNAPHYDFVVVKNDASPRGMRRAKRLALRLNLPIRVL